MNSTAARLTHIGPSIWLNASIPMTSRWVKLQWLLIIFKHWPLCRTNEWALMSTTAYEGLRYEFVRCIRWIFCILWRCFVGFTNEARVFFSSWTSNNSLSKLKSNVYWYQGFVGQIRISDYQVPVLKKVRNILDQPEYWNVYCRDYNVWYPWGKTIFALN